MEEIWKDIEGYEEVKPMIKYNSTKCHFAENKAFRLFHWCFTIPHNAI